MKNSAKALTAILLLATGVGGAFVATPGLAANSVAGALGDCSPPPRNNYDWRKERLAVGLSNEGVKYESIDLFGGCFLVRTRNTDGKVVNRFYDPLTLHRVY